MKIIHCADLHLDSRLTANLPPAKAKQRQDELLHNFIRLAEDAGTKGVQAVLIAGDLFDSRSVSATARNTVLDTIRKYPAITFFYLQGNHEGDSFLSDIPAGISNLKTFGDTWTSYDLGDAVTVNGVVLTPENSTNVSSLLQEDPSKFNIVMLHGVLSEYESKDRAEIINLRGFQNRAIDYLALGHIHQHQEGDLPPRGRWCYPGCLEGRGFDETGEHGYVLIDIDTAMRRAQYEFVPFARRHLYEVEVDVTGCESTIQMIGRAKETLEKNTSLSAMDEIKIVLTGRLDVLREMNLDLIAKNFEHSYYFVKCEDRTRLAYNYAEYAKEATLKGEFVRAVNGAEDLTDQEKAEIIRCGIQALNGEDIEE